MERSGAAIFVAAAMATILSFTPTLAATKGDIDALTSYAVFLGRGVACGVNIKPEMQRVGVWMDRRFPPGSEDQQTFLPIFIQGVQHHAQLQKDGNSPDTCSKVREQYERVPWP